MSPPVVALLFALGFATWVYSKVMRTTGGNTKNSVTVAAIAGLFGFVALLLILKMVENALQN